MATISKRQTTKQSQCRKTRRVMTMLLLTLVLLFTVRVGLTTIQGEESTLRETHIMEQNDEDTVVLSLEAVDDSIVDIRIHLYSEQTPLAAHYIKQLATNPTETCSKCTIYRGEPVPSYWGSPDYPDRYLDGGRWGPPYALVQGVLLSDNSENIKVPPPAEANNPIVKRGMVAWAGGKGGPHFFIALAEHPEWKHDHTVFARVKEEEDMMQVDALLSRPLKSTKPKQPPIVSNFVTPIPFTIQMA